MVFCDSFVLEFCEWAPFWTRNHPTTEIVIASKVLLDFLRIWVPISGYVDSSAAFNFGREYRDETWLQKSTLMLLSLWPRIWKEDMECIDAVIRYMLSQNFVNVAIDDLEIPYSK